MGITFPDLFFLQFPSKAVSNPIPASPFVDSDLSPPLIVPFYFLFRYEEEIYVVQDNVATFHSGGLQ